MKEILIVEDDPILIKAYREMLAGRDLTVTAVRTGRECLDSVYRQQPDLILLDIMLPSGMNGFDVLEDLKGKPATNHIPVIVMTNLDSEAEVAKSIGAEDYLVKANTTREKLLSTLMERLGKQ